MHLDRGIVRTYRRSDGLSMRPNDQNTLNCQSADTKDALRDPLHDPVIYQGRIIHNQGGKLTRRTIDESDTLP